MCICVRLYVCVCVHIYMWLYSRVCVCVSVYVCGHGCQWVTGESWTEELRSLSLSWPGIENTSLISFSVLSILLSHPPPPPPSFLPTLTLPYPPTPPLDLHKRCFQLTHTHTTKQTIKAFSTSTDTHSKTKGPQKGTSRKRIQHNSFTL